MKCMHCSGSCIRKGKQANGSQKYRCKTCGKYQQANYKNQAWKPDTTDWIVRLTREGCGINNIKRLLGISKGTVLRRIRIVAKGLRRPTIGSTNLVIEIDEMASFVRSKQSQVYVCYALLRGTSQVVAFNVGKRSKAMIRPVVEAAKALHPKAICTDGLNLYPNLLKGVNHKVGKRGTRRIERMNLSIRTNLKRMGRKSICFSRSLEMLVASLRVWFWAGSKGQFEGECEERGTVFRL